MRILKLTIHAMVLALLAVVTIPSPVLHSQTQHKPKHNKKKVAVLRQQGQPAASPTLQEVWESGRGNLNKAERVGAFASARRLLLKKRVPFEPNMLLEQNWRETLREALAHMPEFKESRREGITLKGAQLAETLLLPSKIKLDGDTVILAKRLIFEGNDVLIKGNFDVHIFTLEPIFLTAPLDRGAQSLLNVGFKPSLGFTQLRAALPPVEEGHITIDTSGDGRKEWLERRKNKTASQGRSERYMVKAGFRASGPLTPQYSENTSGQRGADGAPGDPGLPGTSGANGVDGQNGACGHNVNGADGSTGGYGRNGENGTNGTQGTRGDDARNITINVQSGFTYTLLANGGEGGWGGAGGPGGTGGRGGDGGKGGNGADCHCSQGGAGEGGRGGDAGAAGHGGEGGRGADGSNGGKGGIVTVNHPPGFDINKVSVSNSGGREGRGGLQGRGGIPGDSGTPGRGGNGLSSGICPGTAGQAGTNGGPAILNGGYGDHGEGGSNGQNGEPGSITFVVTQQVLEEGGGGGGVKGSNLRPYDYYNCTTYYWVLYHSWDDGKTWQEVDRWEAGCW